MIGRAFVGGFVGGVVGAWTAIMLGGAWFYLAVVVPDLDGFGEAVDMHAERLNNYVIDMELRRASREAGNANR